MLKVLRREEKYPIQLHEALLYTNYFSKLLSYDSHSENGAYSVRSLYFDTIDDKDFFNKITEQNTRRKIRLRIYHPQDQYAKLEMKKKENIYQEKRSLLITREDAQAIINGNFSVLLHYPEDFATELYCVMSTEFYRPKSIVEYQRCAFMAKENHIRLTFDTMITGTESNFDLFAENLPLTPIYDPDNAIFEVKYDKFLLGYISEIISNIDRRNISCSKYCLSRSIGCGDYI